MKTIALVEDEKDLNNLIRTYLEKEGYNVVSYYDGESTINNINKDVDLWILDIMLGDTISGYDIIKKIREENPDVPVIFTSARDKDLDKIIGLELGSDDYIAKPYSPKELVLRVNNIIRRVYSKDKQKLTYKDYTIDFEKRMVLHKGESINLTTLEFDLLYMFVTNINKSFSRDDILNNIWGENYFGTDRVVDDLVLPIYEDNLYNYLGESLNILDSPENSKINSEVAYIYVNNENIYISNNLNKVLGLDLANSQKYLDQQAKIDVPEDVLKLLEERKQARQNKNWELSDNLRDKIKELGYAVKDTKDGMTVEKI